ncbi:hypothetical protein CJ030_MR7G011471 [Morella rubra]|uniref:Reverse transcriptase domain-containing protein n=1 Tax=Morella rubra TaxID=262757 RepID=A0A6A1V7J4_9ROSI|nr:hypothetical protein CJ030_MR7G011471 [Morella rubra]
MKSRELWLSTKDLNTKYFHTSTIIHRRHNSIEFLKTEEGTWISSREEVGSYITDYYSKMYQSFQPVVPHDLEGLVTLVVTTLENEALCAIPSANQIHSTLLSLGSFKAPGPDGMTAIFYKKFWHIVGRDVVLMVQHFFVSGFMSREINHCRVVLLPKEAAPSQISQYRPVSLCNVVSKLISKILANRTRMIIDKLISPLQAAFVPGKTIHENSILAHEIFHVLKKRNSGRKIMAIRADIEKAYDRMEWKLILVAMKCFGFAPHFVGWIEQCLSSASCSILLNGTPLGLIKPTRGLRQGDPMAPFLFIIGSEVFSRIWMRAEADHSIHGICIARSAPPITHLLFVDDLLLFTRATSSEAHVVMQCLTKYAGWSGQQLNVCKSTVTFSRNTRSAAK